MTGNNFKTLLNTDEAAAQTILGVADTTGWRVGDEICIASTTQTASQCEKRTILTVDSSTQVTVTSGLTNAHSGTSPTQAEVGNLTRNVKIRGIGTNAPSTTTTLQSYINIASQAVVTLRYCQFSYLGSSTSLKRGIDVATTTGTFDMQYCSIADGWITSSLGVQIASATGGITFSNNATFNIAANHIVAISSSVASTVDNNLFMMNVNGQPIGNFTDAGVSLTNNTFVGSAATGLQISEVSILGTFSNNTSHSSAGTGVVINNVRGGTVTNLTIWRGATSGLTMAASSNVVFDSLVLFGNSTRNILQSAGSSSGNITFNGLVSNGDTTFPTTNGIQLDEIATYVINSADFSTVSGIKTAHTNDISVGPSYMRIVLLNSKMGGTNEVANQSLMGADSSVGSQRHETTAGLHKSWYQGGTLTIDTTIFNTASPSARLTPLSASVKMVSATKGRGFKKKVANGNTVTASVYVRKSDTGAGDATTYNGNFPRLIVRKNVAAGISADTVLATATSASAGAWELLSGTTSSVTDDCVLEFYCDCDGTVGFVSLDDFS